MILFNYAQALAYLETTYGHQAGCGLENVRRVLNAIGSPHEHVPVIHVAGTNGKGSTCAFLSAVLQAAGYTVGVFTSPHLMRFNERIAINNVLITDDDWADELTKVVSAVDTLDIKKPNFFEILTIMAFSYFTRCGVDFAIMETGLGGRLDPTNVVIKPVLCVITAIGYDHMDILGGDLQQIASEKAGIIKQGCPVALYPAEMLSVFENTARQKNALLFYAGRDMHISDTVYTLNHTRFSVKTAYFEYQALTITMLGQNQVANAVLTLTGVHALRQAGYIVDDEAVRNGLSCAQWPCRFEVWPGAPTVVLDGAHNIDGAACFRQSLDRYFPRTNIILVAGMLKTKDYRNIMPLLSERCGHIICTQPSSPNALPADLLANCLESVQGKSSDNVTIAPCAEKAFRLALETAGAGDVVAVAGSLYLVGGLKNIMNRETGLSHDRF